MIYAWYFTLSMMGTSPRLSYTIERYTQDSKARRNCSVATYGPLQVA